MAGLECPNAVSDGGLEKGTMTVDKTAFIPAMSTRVSSRSPSIAAHGECATQRRKPKLQVEKRKPKGSWMSVPP